MNHDGVFSGHIADIVKGRIFKGTITIRDGRIYEVRETNDAPPHFILPGLIDAHIHIESSMLAPAEFARIAVTHGTVATVSDPHEIANVLGMDGIRFMIENGKQSPFKFYFGASSCVPATGFETSGADLGPEEMEVLMNDDEIHYMSEMMNYPGVIYQDPVVMKKLEIARKAGKPVDGHAPGLIGEDARKYIAAGISTDHECYMIEDAREKISYGMKILIREGSAAKNFEELIPLLAESPDMVMFCSDDRHPNDLIREHINGHVKRAIKKGFDPLMVLRAATCNPVKHYNLDVGMLQQGDPADFIIVDNLQDFNILETYINGNKVAEKGQSLLPPSSGPVLNRFKREALKPEDFTVESKGSRIKVIEALDGQLITGEILADTRTENHLAVSDPENDILKIAVINRYQNTDPAIGFIKGFGLREGAIASSVAHDSHNIVVVGCDDGSMARAVNLIIANKGGVSAAGKEIQEILPLEIAGLMSQDDGYTVAKSYENIDRLAKEMGSRLQAPYMTLSFMALLVIPQLKLSDEGLFDGKSFTFTELFEN